MTTKLLFEFSERVGIFTVWRSHVRLGKLHKVNGVWHNKISSDTTFEECFEILDKQTALNA